MVYWKLEASSSSPKRGKHQSGFQKRGGGIALPQSQSLMPPKSSQTHRLGLCCCLCSRDPVRGGASRIPKGGLSRIPEGGTNYFAGQGNCLSQGCYCWEEFAPLRKNGFCHSRVRVMTSHRYPGCCSSTFHPNASHSDSPQATPVHTALFSPKPWVSERLQRKEKSCAVSFFCCYCLF